MKRFFLCVVLKFVLVKQHVNCYQEIFEETMLQKYDERNYFY